MSTSTALMHCSADGHLACIQCPYDAGGDTKTLEASHHLSVANHIRRTIHVHTRCNKRIQGALG
jgi:hypothetical protein